MAIFAIRNRKKARMALISDINVTPLIDVMLVLLVIFMITAPLLTVGVKVDLPSVNAPNITGNETPIVVHVDKERHIFIGEIEVDAETLPEKLRAICSEDGKEARIFVKGDRILSYGHIMDIMGRISSAGFKKVVLVTELPKKQGQNEKNTR
ncbi:MAG: ExbD/TolR family protein [Holosporaceae bacterium]|jgi:biopolymer transport protein TolR|nr:ExbD/TolR family protein [Holosporaceae bacterium]